LVTIPGYVFNINNRKRAMRHLLLATALFGLFATLVTIAPGPAQAQATCRAECTNDENACLQRTGNKGQCGGKAQSCLAKCR
jgi:hypothetical protein